jgi:alcohol dehydrogenase (cytochrome c)
MVTTELIGIDSPSLKERRDWRSRRRVAVRVALVLAVVVMSMTVAVAFYWSSLSKTNQTPIEQPWGKIAWRVRLFTLKARGGIPELSWSELWQMTRQRGGFGMENLLKGVTADGTVRNGYNTDADHRAASDIFRVRCAICHGNEGAGGAVGPPLNHAGLRHGDSDLAIYRVLRDGVPNTAMIAPSLSLVQRWQLVGYVKQLQLPSIGLGAGKTPLNIELSSERLLSAGSKTDEWLTYSGSLDGHRYTPLNQITTANVSQLRIRWVRQFDTRLPSIEATPLVVGGVVFITEPPSDTMAVDALDAKSGDLIWRYSRSVLLDVQSLFGRMNRGVAILDNKLYFVALDGYLVCINANTGDLVWETKVVDPPGGYSLSTAPLIVKRSVVVGVAGSDYGIRGFLDAYDAETGKRQWRFDTVPGPGEAGHETWSGDSWRSGGGSTWTTGSYDPSLDLLYWGTGNPSQDFSGDNRLGDNLYTDSVIALHPGTGKLAWHFQFTPHDVHDWDSTQTPILADIPINGKNRQVICWANRNGFYYVLDRVTGEFLKGVSFVAQTWAKGLDSAGRPILTDADDLSGAGRIVSPGVAGGTNFQNAAFDPLKSLVFVPATEGASLYTKSLHASPAIDGLPPGSAFAYIEPPTPVVRALDAASGTKKWEYFSPPINGTVLYSGLLVTGGGLVFGASGGYVFALDSATGHEVWRVSLGGDTRAAPISFTIDGKQVIAVSAGRALFVFGL